MDRYLSQPEISKTKEASGVGQPGSYGSGWQRVYSRQLSLKWMLGNQKLNVRHLGYNFFKKTVRCSHYRYLLHTSLSTQSAQIPPFQAHMLLSLS